MLLAKAPECRLFLLGRCPKVVFKPRVTSHNNDMSSPLEKGRAKGAGWICPEGASFYVADNVLLAGIVSHAWHEILRLSPHLFWLRLFSHRAFSSVQDDDTGERKGFHLGDTLRVLELSVLYTIRVGPWRRAAPKAQDGSTKRCEKLCETIRLSCVS